MGINFSQADLDKLAEQTDELRTWLEEKTSRAATHVMMPSPLTTVGSIVLVAGLSLVMDDMVPNTMCWSYGGCLS